MSGWILCGQVGVYPGLSRRADCSLEESFPTAARSMREAIRPRSPMTDSRLSTGSRIVAKSVRRMRRRTSTTPSGAATAVHSCSRSRRKRPRGLPVKLSTDDDDFSSPPLRTWHPYWYAVRSGDRKQPVRPAADEFLFPSSSVPSAPSQPPLNCSRLVKKSNS